MAETKRMAQNASEADFRMKRKMMRQDRHAGRETPERHEHSKNAENPFIAAPNVSRPTRRFPAQYISAAAAVLAGFDDSATVTLNDLRDLLRWHFRNELLSG